MKIAVFLGAGFSRAWGLPIMRDFFSYAKVAEYLNEEDKEFLIKLRKQAQASHRMLEVRPGNLEDILSLCFASGQFVGNYPEEASREYKHLCRILQQVYKYVGGSTPQFGFGKRPSAFYSDLRINSVERLLGINNKRQADISLITTNYDIVLEFCLWKLRRPCRLPGVRQPCLEPEIDPRNHLYTLDKKESTPVLCKLHGSINWFQNTGKQKDELRVESRIVHKRVWADDNLDGEPQSRMIEQPVVAYEEEVKVEDVPIIIPPIVFKVQTHPCFKSIWEAAGKALQKADKVVFVGYSFPDSDNYLRYFIASNLTKPDLDKIQIVAPSAKNICDRLAKSNFGSYFKNMLEPVETEWQSGSYSIVD